ncbi:NAD-dependent epimerase/dehydratase family protein [Actinomycetaceae bacterium L2_0104]
MASTGRRAVILGGTGAIGAATALRLAGQGWHVDVTGRDQAKMPRELIDMGVRFRQIDRSDIRGVSALVDDGADLLVDLVAYRGQDVRALVPAMRVCTSIVVVSSRAVYIDPQGRHINGDEAPAFRIPIPETNPTVPPAGPGVDPFSREGYAASKVAVERESLESGLPITVLRPSKVHGRWARNARTAAIVEQMLAGIDEIQLADHGMAIDHLTAAANTAALIETVADTPAGRVLNSADPDPLTAKRIVGAIAEAIGWKGCVRGLEPGREGGDHPWNPTHPIILDTEAAAAIGYAPAGTARELLADEATWVASTLSSRRR